MPRFTLKIIFDDETTNIDNIKELINQFKRITVSRLYKLNLNNPKYNWLDKDIDDVINKVQNYLTSMETVTI